MLKSLLFAVSCLANQVALEQPDGAPIYFGPWYDRLAGDSPAKTNERVGYRPFSLFQSDVNLTDTLQSASVDQIFSDVAATNTDAIVYLTVYPLLGWDIIADSAVEELADKIGALTNAGTRIFIRYASEMNGAWFHYGQQPSKFLASWRQVVTAVRAKAVPGLFAFIWAPNSGNGYPFPNLEYSVTPDSDLWESALDTNNDGVFDINDDPYSPFYPGDEWVDWVGMSAYHYGAVWQPESGLNPQGWITNDVPLPNKVEDIIRGRNGWGRYDFYEMYAGSGAGQNISAGGMPMSITETGSTVHIAVRQTDGIWVAPPGTSPEERVPIKRAWWTQFLNVDFLTRYPKIKMISTFEFIKFEEDSWRDFSSMGGDEHMQSPLLNDGTAKDYLVLEAFQNDLQNGLGGLIDWANATVLPPQNEDPTGPPSSSGERTISFYALTAFFPLLLFLLKY